METRKLVNLCFTYFLSRIGQLSGDGNEIFRRQQYCTGGIELTLNERYIMKKRKQKTEGFPLRELVSVISVSNTNHKEPVNTILRSCKWADIKVKA